MMVVLGEFGFAIFPKLQALNRNLEFRSRKNTLMFDLAIKHRVLIGIFEK